ncbi:MAG: CoB--CoM heterodisulfide reductase iron-sulfur subunit A family protein [Chloroflexota bacterium]|nr:CoB--CoM heterodisulfide reductase iron-sulfur subunit A family protein [Chloroflexota bacterium]
MKEKRIGVFVCHCGLNIAGTVDVERVVEQIKDYPGVAHAEHYIYMCSDPGQELVRKAIREKDLNGIVMSNCSPSLHQTTFRKLAESEGLNPYLCEIANIREQCSWPHAADKETATRKAVSIIKSVIEKLRRNISLTPLVVPLTKRVMVVGAGVAGMQSALDIADSGYEVVLVERSPSIGGHTTQLSGTFLTGDRIPGLVSPMMSKVASHPNIRLYAYSEVEDVSGYVGNFKVNIRSKASCVDEAKCNCCGLCLGSCPVAVPSEFDRGLSPRGAIYVPFPEALPPRPVIDRQACLHFDGDKCHACKDICPGDAIDFGQEDIIAEEEVGAIIVATGYELVPCGAIAEYAPDPDVIDGLQFERLLSPSGPTSGEVRRPSDGKIPEQVVFIQCAGSRDPEHGVSYCSRVCCMYVAKQAQLYKQSVSDGQVYVFYMDIRSDAKGYEEYVKKVVDEERVLYLRGKASKIFRDGDKLKVWGADTLTGKSIEVAADLVVLATAMVPSPGVRELARKLNIITDQHGFITEAHIKLRPVETLTSGIYLAGTAQWPRDLPDTVASASGAASKILSLFSRKELLHEPTVAVVDTEVCSGCGQCVAICSYQAIELDPVKRVARVNEAVCDGCGACSVTCPSKAICHRNWTARQFFEIIDIATADYV